MKVPTAAVTAAAPLPSNGTADTDAGAADDDPNSFGSSSSSPQYIRNINVGLTTELIWSSLQCLLLRKPEGGRYGQASPDKAKQPEKSADWRPEFDSHEIGRQS
jgi:hypothetical protein